MTIRLTDREQIDAAARDNGWHDIPVIGDSRLFTKPGERSVNVRFTVDAVRFVQINLREITGSDKLARVLAELSR